MCILNEVKRNQLERDVKLRALMMRMRCHRRMEQYEQSLLDARTARAMMTDEQAIVHYPHIKTEIRELKVSSILVVLYSF